MQTTKQPDGSGTGAFTSSILGLTINTTYYARAYATNSLGTVYGTAIQFTTGDGIPVLTTKAVTDITISSAVSGGDITDDGGDVITARGVCWNTTGNPTIADNKAMNGSGTGIFTSTMTDLARDTTYFVRAYATNNFGTVYGTVIQFSTRDGIPIIYTIEVTDITNNSATSGGNITDDGGDAITTRGVCWSSVGNPTIYDNKTSDGVGTGSFISLITGLMTNTTHYVRAYATNSFGTVYGYSRRLIIPEDADGNIYSTIQIGSQLWLGENLRTTRFEDGTSIGNDYSSYNNDAGNVQEYGALYRGYALLAYKDNLCPVGWHIPSESEWKTLINYLGGSSVAGGKMKEQGLSHWKSPNTGATNESGFTALPGGTQSTYGYFCCMGDNGWFWSSTHYIENFSYVGLYSFNLSKNDTEVDFGRTPYTVNLSVRCLKD